MFVQQRVAVARLAPVLASAASFAFVKYYILSPPFELPLGVLPRHQREVLAVVLLLAHLDRPPEDARARRI